MDGGVAGASRPLEVELDVANAMSGEPSARTKSYAETN
jgi:hypothetical protein